MHQLWIYIDSHIVSIVLYSEYFTESHKNTIKPLPIIHIYYRETNLFLYLAFWIFVEIVYNYNNVHMYINTYVNSWNISWKI